MTKTCVIWAVFVAGLTFAAGCGGASTGQDASVDAGPFDGSSADGAGLDAGPAADGAPCDGPDGCASGFCVDGVCCEAACDGLCVSCRGAETGGLDGACQPVIALTDPASECLLDEASCAPGTCDGAGACALGENGSVCRPGQGGCDVPEVCAGGACPPDEVQPDGFECRTAEGPCDVAEQCDGVDAVCPVDAFVDATMRCRDSAGACDPEEHCTGVSAACPADTLTPLGSMCRPANGACDLAELCTGSAPGCPNDAYALPGTVCRASAGSCDVEETCGGSDPACPGDVTAPMTCPVAPNSSASCVAGECTYACSASYWGDCDSAPGCETPLNTHSNCGRCGQGCGPFTCRATSLGWACRP